MLSTTHLHIRRPACTSYGLGTEETLLNINMLADKKKDDYCGVFINEKSEERSVAVAVIIHNRNMSLKSKPKLMIQSLESCVVAAKRLSCLIVGWVLIWAPNDVSWRIVG